jgi:hypothetical protein
MQRSIPVSETVLAELLAHAAAAAHIIGHVDDHIATDRLGEHIDAIAHELTELLHSLPASNAVTPCAPDSGPMLTSSAGDVR